MRNKSKSNNDSIQELACVEQIEENGICELPVSGNTVAQFSFANNSPLIDEPMIKGPQPEVKKSEILLSDLNSPLKFKDKKTMPIKDSGYKGSYPYGITPPVNGEYFNTRRSFTLRESTVRMLNELKAADPDINVYLNSIVDRALRHYHDYIFKEKGAQN